ncbi:hypothetical protein FRC08_015031 [Ceratobasidium sp. 394]|nr:hypothetical protein FRC08_015031 [Ceratobasidium sp. 394]
MRVVPPGRVCLIGSPPNRLHNVQARALSHFAPLSTTAPQPAFSMFLSSYSWSESSCWSGKNYSDKITLPFNHAAANTSALTIRPAPAMSWPLHCRPVRQTPSVLAAVTTNIHYNHIHIFDISRAKTVHLLACQFVRLPSTSPANLKRGFSNWFGGSVVRP